MKKSKLATLLLSALLTLSLGAFCTACDMGNLGGILGGTSSTGSESTGSESTGEDSTGSESTGGESTGEDSTGSESTGGDSAGGDISIEEPSDDKGINLPVIPV